MKIYLVMRQSISSWSYESAKVFKASLSREKAETLIVKAKVDDSGITNTHYGLGNHYFIKEIETVD